MRTTLVLEDELMRWAKHRAAELNLTVSDVVNQALRKSLAEEPREAPPFRMPTYGGSRRVRHEPAEFSVVSDDEDTASRTTR